MHHAGNRNLVPESKHFRFALNVDRTKYRTTPQTLRLASDAYVVYGGIVLQHSFLKHLRFPIHLILDDFKTLLPASEPVGT